MRTSFFFAVTSLASMLALAAACSSSTTTVVSGDAGDEEADATTTTKDAGKDSSTKDAGEKDSASADPDQACFSQSGDQCAECCFNNHQEGAAALSNALLACACEGTGSSDSTAACATECASAYCAADPKEPTQGDACDKCVSDSLAKTGKCYDAALAACQASDDCVTWQTSCLANCQ